MYYDIAKNEIVGFIKKYQINPFEFLTEYDLQSYLYFKIFDTFEKKDIKLKIKTSEDDKSVRIFNPSGVIEINPTRREYSAFDGFDIAIIDNTNIKTQLSGYWHQELKVAIELKYHRSSMGNSVNKLIKGFKSDLQKLENYKYKNNTNFYGIAMLFIQNNSHEKELELEKQFKNEYDKIDDINEYLFKSKINGFIITKEYIYKLR
ncbi:MAG: hypothetical protein U9R37_05105 [Campylobacterota bacterium]|nr:hypothetical protein [Campylobacterota bacterium]